MQHWTLTVLEVILWPFVFVAKIIWTAIKWILYILGELFGYMVDC